MCSTWKIPAVKQQSEPFITILKEQKTSGKPAVALNTKETVTEKTTHFTVKLASKY